MTIQTEESVFIAVVIEPLPDDAPAWADTLNTNLATIATGINQTNAAIGAILDVVNDVKTMVGPTLDSLAKSPILKMMGVKP